VGLLLRHPLPVAICSVAIAATVGVFVFARPEYRPVHQGTSIRLPDKRPAADAPGRAGWTWPDGVPVWEPGETIGDYPVSGMQAIEAQPAQLAAAHAGLDAERVRVLVAMHIRPGAGPLAIVAAPQLDSSPQTVCLAALLPLAAQVEWRCPGASRPYADVARARVLVGLAATGRVSLYLVGVARGDVRRVVLHLVGNGGPTNISLYERGTTWGQFSFAFDHASGAVPELRIYGDRGLVQVLRLDVRPDGQRVFG
jgi:hypothetical protein